MARDNKKNSAYDSGIRGKERAPAQFKAKTSASDSKALLLPNGALRMEILPAENGLIVNCSYPEKRDGKVVDYGWSPAKPKVFTTAKDLAEYVETALKVEDKEES